MVIILNHEKRLGIDVTCANLAIKYNMLYKSIIFTIILSHLSLVLCSDESIARILLHKVSTTSPVIEGKPFEISYNVINNGEASAYSIQITDRYDPNR